jgi:hypothetical protein
MKNKKGIEWGMSLTSKLILALAFTAVGLMLINQLRGAIVSGYDVQGCKMSVAYNSKFRIPIIEREEMTVDCPTRYVTISPKEIAIEAEDHTITEKIKCGDLTTEESKKCFLGKVNSQISNLIFDCWDQFAAGQIPVFSRYEADRQCILCSRVEFTQDVKNLFGTGDQELSWAFPPEPGEIDYPLDEYMRNHKPTTHDISYYEFSLDKTDAFNPPYYDYDLNKPRAVVFVALNQPQTEYLLGKTWDTIKTLGKSDGKEYEYVNTLEWVPYDEVVQKCDVLV